MLIKTEIEQLPIVNMLGISNCHRGWQLYSRRIEDFELILLLQGECHFVLENKETVLRENDYFILLPGVEHSILPIKDGASFYYLHFSLANYELCEKLTLNNDFFSESKQLYLAVSGTLEQEQWVVKALWEKALQENLRQGQNRRLLLSAILLEILCFFSKDAYSKQIGIAAKTTYSSAYSSMIRDAIFYIQSNLGKELTTNGMSSLFKVTPHYFIRAFKENLGMTPLQYINYWKIAKAKSLISMNEMSLQEICYALHFETPHYFSRLFRKIEGITPSEYKKICKI
ncbi:MAG: AraC family transcriptional regulator [Clostridia bacterium]